VKSNQEEKRKICIVLVGKLWLASIQCTERALIGVLNALPDLREISGLYHPSKKFIRAINRSSLPTHIVGADENPPVSVKRIRTEPDILRKLRISSHEITDVKSFEWLTVASPVHVNHLEFLELQAGIMFLDQLPTISSLNSIGLTIDKYNYQEADEFTEKLRTRMHELSRQGLNLVSFNVFDLSGGFKKIPTMPLVGPLLNIFSSADATGQDNVRRLYDYSITLATQQSSSYSNWDAWKINSLKIGWCPSDPSFLKALFERAPFLEELDIYEADEDSQWAHAAFTTVSYFLFL
jgi:hypothetical protein